MKTSARPTHDRQFHSNLSQAPNGKIAVILFLLLFLGIAAGPTQAQDDPCSDTSSATDAINTVLDSLVPVLNAAWPSLAQGMGLDPWENVWDGKIKIGCSYGGTEICAAQAAWCDDFYVKIDVDSITGLSYLEYEDFEVTSIDGEVDEGGFCALDGQGDGSADLDSGQQLKISMDKIKLKVKCDWGLWTETETLYSGSATCTVKDPKATADYYFEADTCASGSPALVLSEAGPFDLNLKVDGDVDCDFSPSYSPVSWIADVVVPAFTDDIVDAITPSLEDALESLVDDELPFPSACD